jgi:hypothetical protein
MKPAFIDLLVYDTFEVHPVVALNKLGDPIPRSLITEVAPVEFEQCDEDEVDIFMWSVYGHFAKTAAPERGLLCLVDCADKNTAYFVARLFDEEREIQRSKAWNKRVGIPAAESELRSTGVIK